MSPRHSIDFCPICGGGLCGIRVYGVGDSPPAEATDSHKPDSHKSPHGLIICDECEAIWLEPDTSTIHVYPDLDNPVDPISGEPLWGETSRWATSEDIQMLGWQDAVNSELDVDGDEKMA